MREVSFFGNAPGQLPNLHYLAVFAGGRIVKGRLPILGTSKGAS